MASSGPRTWGRATVVESVLVADDVRRIVLERPIGRAFEILELT